MFSNLKVVYRENKYAVSDKKVNKFSWYFQQDLN